MTNLIEKTDAYGLLLKVAQQAGTNIAEKGEVAKAAVSARIKRLESLYQATGNRARKVRIGVVITGLWSAIDNTQSRG